MHHNCSKMKIGIYIPSNIKSSDGGSFGYYHQLLKELFSRETEHQFVLLCGKDNSDFLKENNIIGKNIPILNISARSDRILFLLKFLKRLFRLFFLKQIENYFFNKMTYHYTKKLRREGIEFIYYLALEEYLTLDIPFLTNVWDLGHRNVNYFPEVSSFGEFEKREKRYNKVLLRATFISSESETGKKDIEFYFRIKPEKIIVMPLFPGNVINITVVQEEQNNWLIEKGLISKTFLFYPAQFWAHKNHINLLKAIRLLKEQYKIEVSLVLTGSDKGNLFYVKNKISEYNLQKQVHYLGFISEKEIRILYENAAALIMPTFLGPTTMPVLESLAIGCPIICSDFEGHREQLLDSALYFSPNDPNEMAEKIEKLFNTNGLIEELKIKSKNIRKNSLKNSVDILLKAFYDFQSIRDCWDL